MLEVQEVPTVRADDSYESALGELLKLEFFGMKLGLQNITALTEALGHPERAYKTIHVAGTNGKGSVSAMLSAVFQSAGLRTGLYTSPHLVTFRERMKLSGEMISEAYIRDFLAQIWPLAIDLRATFFEATTAMAFAFFRDQAADIAIIETGLGGRLDATNILEHPLVTVVTSIGWDHMKQLGDSLESIASEKAGIFKPGVPAIVNVEPDLRHVFEARAQEVGCPLYFVEDELPSSFTSLDFPLTGHYQEQNLRTVLTALEHVDIAPNTKTIIQGIEHVRRLTGFRARMETYENAISRERVIRILLDVGHNLNAIRAIREEFARQGVRPIVVAGLMRDKDIEPILVEYAGFSKAFVAVQADNKRALESSELYEAAMRAGIKAMDGGSVERGIKLALAESVPGDTLFISGSHYVVGEFLVTEAN